MSCEQVKEFLSREKYAFTERNVEEDDQAYRELIARGFRTVPLTIINGQPVKGFNQAALRAALESTPNR